MLRRASLIVSVLLLNGTSDGAESASVDCGTAPHGSLTIPINPFAGRSTYDIGNKDHRTFRWREKVTVVATGGGALAITAEGFGPELPYNDIAAHQTPYTVIENTQTDSKVTAYVPAVEAPLKEAPPVWVTYYC